MKPLKLTMVAFGPYAQKVELDFTKGLRDNIFVITGNTGAGKTTIFDAICYALYGATSDNNGRQAVELRSHFANEQTEKTYVEFEFAIHGQAYRVKRMPPQLRKKTRGEGFTEEKHTVELKKLDEDSVSITRVEDVERELNSLLGLTLEQFKRIVMLPQGAFREFLQDKSSDKTLLLRRLFDTSFYDSLTELLGAKSKELSESVKELETKMYTNLTHVACDSESELAELITNKGYIPDVINQLEELVAELDARYQDELKQIQLAAEQLTDLEKSVNKAREQQMLIEERARLEVRLSELNAQAEQVKLAEHNLSYAQLAEKNLATEAILASSVQELQQMQVDLQNLLAQLPTLTACDEQAQLAVAKLDSLDKQMNELQNQITMLQGYLPKIKQLHDLDKSLQLILQELTNKEQALKMSDKKEQLDNINKQRDQLRLLYKELQNKERQLALQAELQEKYKQLEQDWQVADKELNAQRELLMNSAAITLARELTDGAPCPVCGSLEHPQIIDIQGVIPSKAAVDKLDREVRASKKELDAVNKNIAELQLDVSKLDAAIAVITAREDVSGLVAGKLDINNIGHLGVALKGQADGIIKEFAQQGLNPDNLPDKKILQDNLLALQARLNSEQGQKAVLIGDVPEIYRDAQLIKSELQNLQQKQTVIKQDIQNIRNAAEQSKLALNSLNIQIAGLQDNLQAKQHAVAEWQTKHEEFLQLYFAASRENYLIAKTYITEIATLQKQVQEYQQAVDVCNLRLYELKHLILPDSFDLLSLERNLADAREIVQVLQEKMSGLKYSLDNNKRILHILQADFAESGERIKQHAVVSKLFRLANGGAAHRMKLETFVLSTYFDDILAHANVRLQKMTNNQYLLVRRTENSGRGFKGLEIDVDDAHTGKLRSVSTLSGGESFKASLALALGLADVVQANAGGIQLDTMLIDEGFGTLDEESLDVAIDTLMELQAHGRVIGVISHVAALKNRIACKLVVEKGVEGSTAWFE